MKHLDHIPVFWILALVGIALLLPAVLAYDPTPMIAAR